MEEYPVHEEAPKKRSKKHEVEHEPVTADGLQNLRDRVATDLERALSTEGHAAAVEAQATAMILQSIDQALHVKRSTDTVVAGLANEAPV